MHWLVKASLKLRCLRFCCAEHSSLRAACEKFGLPYLGVSANMQSKQVRDMFLKRARRVVKHMCGSM